MKSLMQRRKFLQAAGAATLGGAGLALAERAPDNPAPASPSASPRLMAGCCAYSFRKFLQHGPMTMEDFILKGVEMGLNGVDMTAYYFKSTDPAYLANLRHLAAKNGMPFSGLGCGSSMVQADPAKRAAVLEEIKKWVDATDALGAPHLRISVSYTHLTLPTICSV